MSKNYFVKILSYFIFAQAVFVFYKFIPMLFQWYSPEAIFLLPWGLAITDGILATITGIGILLKKKWGIIFYFIFAIFPILAAIFLSQIAGLIIRTKLPGISENWLVITNTIFAFYILFSEWKEWTTQKKS